MSDVRAVVITGPVDDAQAAELCRLAHQVLDTGATRLVVATAGRVDLSVVEALARLRLLTRRRGAALQVQAGTDPAADSDSAADSPAGGELSLQALLDFAGLDGVVDPDESC